METTKSKQLSRGIRNNNPFNIRRSTSRWIGLVPSKDSEFCQFSTMRYGLRAGLILLRNYVRKGFDTPRKIIERFAPSTENDTEKYLEFVCNYGMLLPDNPIRHINDICYLASRIVAFENGFVIFSYFDMCKICRTFKIKL